MRYNKELIKEDARELPKLIVGFIVMSMGIVLNIHSALGLSSWNIFHDGLGNTFEMPFGLMIQLVGLIILLLSIVFLKTKVGPGTILNILLVGFIIDEINLFFTFQTENYLIRAVMLICGILLMTFGRALYISTKLGPGPRDGLFVGLSRVLKVDVKYIKPVIEFTVLVIGFVLGGTAGVGTVITIVVSGYCVQFFFERLGFDSKTATQRSIKEYVN